MLVSAGCCFADSLREASRHVEKGFVTEAFEMLANNNIDVELFVLLYASIHVSMPIVV